MQAFEQRVRWRKACSCGRPSRSRKILEARMKHLQFQVQQQQNKQIGRVGAKAALTEPGPVEG